MKNRTNYVAGFMFDESKEKVLLIRKNKPAWQKDKLNGIGGKVGDNIPNETDIQAMVREFEEETGIKTFEDDWTVFLSVEGSEFLIIFYWSAGWDLTWAKTVEDEPVEICNLSDFGILPNQGTVENLPWILALAIDSMSDGRPSMTYTYYDNEI